MHQITLYQVAKNELGNDDLMPLPHISPSDRGILYADGLFETILVKNRKLIHIDAHIKRMVIGLRRLNINFKVPSERLIEFANEDVLDSGERDAVLRISVTRGQVTGNLGFTDALCPTIIVEIKPLAGDIPNEINIITAAERRNEFSILSSIKSLNYLSNLAAKQEANRMNAYDALLLNTKGDIAECTTSNIFAVIQNELVTPPLEAGILPGITRGVVLSIANMARIQESTRRITPAELQTASEIFTTNSIKGILPVKKWDQFEFAGANGPITQKLQKRYSAELELA